MTDMRKIYAEMHNALKLFVRMNGKAMTDEEALSVSGMHEEWKAGRVYAAEDVKLVVSYNGNLYRIASAHTAQAHYPPDGPGLLALYRPIVVGHEGTEADPIPYTYGMDVSAGLYYSYNDKVWIAQKDMKPCVWPPAESNEWKDVAS